MVLLYCIAIKESIVLSEHSYHFGHHSHMVKMFIGCAVA